MPTKKPQKAQITDASLSDPVKANTPRKKSLGKSATSQKIKKKPQKSVKKRKKTTSGISPVKLLLILSGFFGFLLFLFYAVLFWGLLGGGVQSAFFQSLGLSTADVKLTLLTLTNTIFGFIGLIFLIGGLMALFQWILTDKKAKKLKKQYGFNTILRFLLMILSVAAWVTLYAIISRISVSGDAQNNNNIQLIRTQPAVVVGLEAPVLINFDIGTELVKQIDPTLIRLIEWDFDGDGTFEASGTNVSYNFEKKGRFPVDVLVTYFNPTENTEKTYKTAREVIITNEKVQAILEATPDSGEMPLTVEFSALNSTDPDGTILEYAWDFDNDDIFEEKGSDLQIITKTFEKTGEFPVKLRVLGTNNDTHITETIITVTNPAETMRAVINSEIGFEGLAPLRLNLDANSSFSQFGRIVRYQWFLEDETTPRSGKRIEKVFREAGEYELRLEITNEDGENAETTQKITVLEDLSKKEVILRSNPPFDDKKNMILKGKVPLKIVFDTSLSTVKDPVDWIWDFQDDGIEDAFEEAVQFTYQKAGSYNGKVNITDARGNSYQKTFQIEAQPAGTVARISANPQSGTVPLLVSLDGSASTTDSGDIINYRWFFPNLKDPIEYQSQIQYEFNAVGDFPVKLEVVTSTGKIAEEEYLISVRNQPVQAEFTVSPQQGEAPLAIKVDPSGTKGTVFDFSWDFGDGSTSTQFAPTHVYRNAGNYTLTLKVTDPRGVVSTKKTEITVE